MKITEHTLSVFVQTCQEAIEYSAKLGYPVEVSSSLTSLASCRDIDSLSFVANNERGLHSMLQQALDASSIHKIIIKRVRPVRPLSEIS